MKFFHSSKAAHIVIVSLLVGLATLVCGSKSLAATAPPVLTFKPNHTKVITTLFWVGEPGDKDNNYIPNSQSAWDEHWQAHYGGVDTPYKRKGYWPAAFKPKENPFYFALPYDDYTDQNYSNGARIRRSTAMDCPNSSQHVALAHYSWCKNSWIAIRYNGKVAYAQWEDVGPYQENDVSYVFGTSAPKNTIDPKAGLDVSPAVLQNLQLNGLNKTDWTFVKAANVPAGPWKTIVTTDKGDSN